MPSQKKVKAQSAVEYLILTTTILVVVLVGFSENKGFLTQARNLSAEAFNEALRGIMGTNSVISARTMANNYP